MAWPITGINQVTVSCVAYFENKVYKTNKILSLRYVPWVRARVFEFFLSVCSFFLVLYV